MSISRPKAIRGLPGGASRELRAIAGPDALYTDPADCCPYGYDNSGYQEMPQAVVFATEEEQVGQIVSLCNRWRIPLTARGLGTGTTGGSVPRHGGIVLSFERMKRILRVDPGNRLAVVEPGVINQHLQQVVGELGLFWPPDPSSAPVCTVGGNLAYNSAGPRAVKYGTPRENTLGLVAFTGTGERVKTGVSTTKGVVGYDLTRLLIGSEGTLALITQATLRLLPLPEVKRSLCATYGSVEAAAKAVSAIMAQPVTPCALELVDGGAIEIVRADAGLDLKPDIRAMLLIEVDGPKHDIDMAKQAVMEAARVVGARDVVDAQDPGEHAALWAARQALAPALRRLAPKRINEDVVVPVSRMAELFHGLEDLSQKTGIRIVSFGHAGNGNVHVNLLIDPSRPGERARSEECLKRLFSLVIELDGTISGEHGVGIAKRPFVEWEMDPVALRLMQGIKNQFDPNGVLNPGKSLPGI